jgi:limonene 1,2-monooxygenase
MRFGSFIAPFHPAGINPTAAMEQDLRMVEELDRLGYDEAWVGEHHSAGTEIISSPEIFLAAALSRTRRISLATGVVSASYHNPLWVAERAVQLDHMSRGRFVLGLGPGALPSDAAMIGLDMKDTRNLLEDAVDVVTRLLRTEEPVTFANARWDLREARTHLRPFTEGGPEVVIAAVASPSGPRLAGRYGHGLLSLGLSTAAGFDALAMHWDVMEERAAHYGSAVDRRAWRLVGQMHLAETRSKAIQEVAYGIEMFNDYNLNTAGFAVKGVGDALGSVEELAEGVNASGLGVIGTPDDAVALIERLWEQSRGGFGCYLQMAHNWASPADAMHSHELFARHVMPYFQGQRASTLASRERARVARAAFVQDSFAGVEMVMKKYQDELNEKPPI